MTTTDGVLIDFQDAQLGLVVAALAEAGGLNVVYAELPDRRITLRMQQPVPRENILPLLRSLAQSNGLRVVEEDNFIRLVVTTPGTNQQDVAEPAGAVREAPRLFVYRLKHARAAKLGGTLQNIFGGRGEAAKAGEGAAHGGRALSQQLQGQKLPPTSLDGAPSVDVDVSPAEPSLPADLHGEVQIVPDEGTNALIIRAQPSDWETIKAAIETLDRRPLQVLIEVLIAEVRRTKDLKVSVSGQIENSGDNPHVRGTLEGETDGNALLEVLRAGNLDVTGALSLLASKGQVKILSRPVVLAQNNQEARILIGAERPFVQVSRTLPTDAGVRDQVIQYRDVGTKLTILPTINDDGYVNLQVLQEVSTATAETQFGAPVISTREASTYLFVKDGQTAVLGGLIDHQQEKTRTGIPLLMDIPILGALFGSTRNTTSNSELFLFLTPHIIVADEDTDRLRESVEQSTELLDEALPTTKGGLQQFAPDSATPAAPFSPGEQR